MDKTISKLKRSKNDFLLLIDVTKEGDNINFIKLIEAFTDDTHFYIVSSKETVSLLKQIHMMVYKS